MPQGCLGTFNKGLPQVSNSECCSVGIGDLEVDDRITMKLGQMRKGFPMGGVNLHIDGDVITGDNVLAANSCDLNLDVYNLERLRADVYFDKSRVDRLVELSEARNKTNRA